MRTHGLQGAHLRRGWRHGSTRQNPHHSAAPDLVPVSEPPLDGGRVLHGLIWLGSGDRRRATRAATGAGQIVGSLLAALGLLMALNGRWDGLWLGVVGWFLTGSAVGERAYAAFAEEVDSAAQFRHAVV